MGTASIPLPLGCAREERTASSGDPFVAGAYVTPKHPGAQILPDGRCAFRVWAPHASTVAVVLSVSGERIELARRDGGYFEDWARVPAGTRYQIVLDSREPLPDPASRFQPDGVHGASEVVDLGEFAWTDSGWRGVALRAVILYELHVGTFTREGTLDAAIADLDRLRGVGVTAIELMPVAEFPGARNWGYDGVFPYAVQSSYGGPLALQRFVDAAHARGIAVILDVVYNHLGPEGNRLDEFGPYFTDRYRTPWGRAVNFDGADSDAVREFSLSNAIFWLREFHLDGLRLDAVHGIYDLGARHILAEMRSRVQELERGTGRTIHLIAESDLNDAKFLRGANEGGYGLSAQWSDDFHHALHVLLTGERNGYYVDFNGLADLARALQQGWRYAGDYSTFRRRHHGNSPKGLRPEQFVVCSQNHDQIGNRAVGDRLTSSLGVDRLKLAAAAVLLSPFVPLLFMGEEYGETAPFPYFTSHSDPALTEAVRRGRREEFAAFGHSDEVPDPQAESTFESAKIDRTHARTATGREISEFYGVLIRVRNEAGIAGVWPSVSSDEASGLLRLEYRNARIPLLVLFNFGSAAIEIGHVSAEASWKPVLNSNSLIEHKEEIAKSGRISILARSVMVFKSSEAAKAIGAS
ncbi:MAG: malto-oligosyltrehalose trehalohydrolase [Candidatus Acidiferrales bacterium]|jgi:maltooligosyltrehalose trehalohydrolase